MGQSSYQNDSDVLLHLVNGQGKGNCDIKSLFKGQGGCDEYELKNDKWEIITQVSKLYTDIILKSETLGSGSSSYDKLSWGETYQIGSTTEEDDNGNMILTGFDYNEEQSGKFNPSSPLGELVDTQLSDPSNGKNHLRNTPYFYFGLIPGKTAIDKLRKNYFIN
jgi:hypothetical protein